MSVEIVVVPEVLQEEEENLRKLASRLKYRNMQLNFSVSQGDMETAMTELANQLVQMKNSLAELCMVTAENTRKIREGFHAVDQEAAGYFRGIEALKDEE